MFCTVRRLKSIRIIFFCSPPTISRRRKGISLQDCLFNTVIKIPGWAEGYFKSTKTVVVSDFSVYIYIYLTRIYGRELKVIYGRNEIWAKN
jgi:hypothetical protein